jgi:hypothetical protein
MSLTLLTGKLIQNASLGSMFLLAQQDPAVQASAEAAVDAASGFIFIFLLGVFLLLYFFPTLIAVLRKHASALAIFAFNLFFGWTGLGWVAALIWSLTSPSSNTPVIVNQIMHGGK